MQLPEDVLTYILSYLPFVELDECLEIFKIKKENHDKIRQLIYKQQVKIIQYIDRVEYTIGGELWRLDGPAIEYTCGYKSWWKNGKKHRIGGPAFEGFGYIAWYENGKYIDYDLPAPKVHINDVYDALDTADDDGCVDF